MVQLLCRLDWHKMCSFTQISLEKVVSICCRQLLLNLKLGCETADLDSTMPQSPFSTSSLSTERLSEINCELINACLDGNFQRTKELCKQYPACINIIGGAGYPPLHYALYTQNYDLTAYMVSVVFVRFHFQVATYVYVVPS